ncbi:hybrid sensor histidine kinase/response regulator [Marinicellulosiphila megalodicopiae]|uniref:hybrid sensor histidine kinase/response regulator n=1 Tax=Marinicellulosiphila megalodicopiae TaxID=2724896 RepID=UPI003BB1DF20
MYFTINSYGFARVVIDQSEQFKLIDDVSWRFAEIESITDIQQDTTTKWLPSPDTALSLGLIDKTVWVKFELEVTNQAISDTYVIAFGNSTLTYLELYHQTPDQQLFHMGPIGMSLAFNTDQFMSTSHNHFDIDLSLKGNHSIWIKIKQNGYFDLPLTLNTPKHAFNERLSLNLTSSLFYGFFLALTLYHLFYLSIIRDPIYLSYVFFTVGVALQFGYMDGILFQYIWPHTPTLNALSGKIAVPLVSLSIILLCLNFLNIKKENKLFKYFSKAILYLNFTALFIALFVSIHVSIFISLCILLLTFLCVPVISLIHYYIHKDPISLIFICSITSFIILCIIITMSIIGLMPFDINNLWNTLKIVMGAQMLIFASAIAFRIRYIDKERKKALHESKAKSEIIAKVSHELRTPLNGILGLSHLMTPMLKGQTKTYNHMIHQSATALLTVINDLLDVSRINAGKFSINLHPTNLHDLIHSICSSLFTQLNGSGIQTQILIGKGVPKFVQADSDRLRQLIGNLLGNAIKFTQQGCITLDVDLVYRTHNMYRFKVIDTGAGISEENIQRIFNPYEQADSNGNSSQTSTGLGLFITQQLAKAMGAEIHVESTINEGSTFWFTIELEKCDDIDTNIEIHNKPQKSLDILVAEDNSINQLIISKLLSNLGHKYAIKNNGQQALDELKSKTYDLVLMDCDMPVLDGYNAVIQWREYEKANHLPHLKIIALTAHAYQGHKQKILDCGMDQQILKPIKPKELDMILRQDH